MLTGHAVHSVVGHDEVVRDVSWHPHRQEVLTTSWDSTVNINTYAYKDPPFRGPIIKSTSEYLRRSKRIAQQQRTGNRN